ncbi:ribonuclease 3-like protein 2 [Zingiber officinale]|uniref:Uncharacterized protein n=1 Tax=Zingiber officinale TaxID=94328 RepID=A0A8J5FI04_ZINOF|nr:ribonuclease 3-like protein 2 [Zingiber officinale]KAG6487135.1 hypothetical protein ZIOFF_055718 [Zingiber officinale]
MSSSNALPAAEDNSDMLAAVVEVQRLLGYTFRQPSLLVDALTHPSFADHPSYQRLEFVGDAALGLAFTNFLYLTNPDLGPGKLSSLRSVNVSTEKLARVAVRHRLFRLLRHNSPLMDQTVNEFTNVVMMEPDEDSGLILYGGSTVKAPKVLADIVESIAAAVYVDCNFNLELLWKVFRGILEPIITWEIMDEQPITTLHMLCQKHGKILDIKNLNKDSLNITNVFVDGILLGIGSSEQKVIAKLNAARDALQKLSFSCHTADMDVDLCSSSCNGVQEIDGSKKRLNEYCIKKHWLKPTYKVEKEEGPGHGKRFTCSVQVEAMDNTLIALGDPKPRVKDAENSAAFKMLSDGLCNMI